MTGSRGKRKPGSKSLSKFKRKAERKTLSQILQLDSKNILHELNEARTEASTRRALAIAKLFGSTKFASVEKARNWGKKTKKVLLHPLPPKTSIMATAFAIVWGVISVASISSGWANAPISVPAEVALKPVALSSQVEAFHPGQVFNNFLASASSNVDKELASLNQGALALAPVEPLRGQSITYYHRPMENSIAVLATPQLAQSDSSANNPTNLQGQVLGAYTIRAKSSIERISPKETAK